MSGIIIGAYGFQRSGKSLISFLLAESYYKRGIPVYTNVDCEGYNKIESIGDLPFNNEPKVLWLDEIQFYLDSRKWMDNTESSAFFNTVGKQNILLLLTTIHPDMIDIRLRRQHNYVYLVKSDSRQIYYRLLDNVRRQAIDFTIEKTDRLFSKVRYDSRLVPDMVDMDLSKFMDKVKAYNEATKTRKIKTKQKTGGQYL